MYIGCPLLWLYVTVQPQVGMSILDVLYWAMHLTRVCGDLL